MRRKYEELPHRRWPRVRDMDAMELLEDISRAACMKGPHGLTAYFIKEESMKRARELTKDVRKRHDLALGGHR